MLCFGFGLDSETESVPLSNFATGEICQLEEMRHDIVLFAIQILHTKQNNFFVV